MTENLRIGDENAWDAIAAPSITLYIDEDKDAFGSYVSAYDFIIKYLRPYITSYQTGSMRGSKKTTTKSFELFHSILNSKAYVETYWLNLYSGVQPNSLGDWGFCFSITPAELDWQAGYFHVFFPPDFLINNQAEFLAIVRELCELVPFCSGTAGYCVQYDILQNNEKRDDKIHTWANRYLCLDVADLEMAVDVTKNKIKTVNWITLLGNKFVGELDGDAEFNKMAVNGIELEKTSHGVLVRAGEQPLLGDINRKEDVILYRKVNEFIRPARTPSLLPLPGFDKNQTQEWLERFDYL